MNSLFVVAFLCGIAAASQQTLQDVDDQEGCIAALSINFQCGGIDDCPAKLNNIIPLIGEPEWKLVFKAVSRIAGTEGTDPLLYDPYTVWNREAPLNEDVPAARQLDTTFQGHYKSSFALNWERRHIQEVKVTLLDATGTELVSMTFDGEGTDKVNWFKKNRILSSPYDDIFTEPQNFFSVAGDTTSKRRWYINRNYGSCTTDVGWLIVASKMPATCPWEKHEDPKPNFLYSKKRTFSNWNTGGDIGEASLFAIFVKTCKSNCD